MAIEERQARALWHVGPGRSELRTVSVRRAEGEALVRTEVSAISRGTERLVRAGRVPESERTRMRAPLQEGDFPFPVKYGYAAVGVVEKGPAALIGRRVFALHPHQTLFSAPAALVTPLPDGCDPRRAALAANMETALNAAWDAGAAPGDRIAVVGGGAVGLLLAALLSRLPGVDLTVVDITRRDEMARAVDVKFTTSGSAPTGCDIAFHCSASAAGLATALGTLGPEGTLVEMSWHGAGETPIPLGGAFHSGRLRILSSQVGHLPPARRPRWSHARRLATALEIVCADPRLDALVTEEIPFDDLPDGMARVCADDWDGVIPLVRYG